MSCASSSDVYHAGRSQVFLSDPMTNATRVVMDFSRSRFDSQYGSHWKSSTLTATHGVLVVGSFRGEYAMASVNATWGSKPIVGTITADENGITNYVETYFNRTNAHPLAAFCSNDRKIRTLDCYTNTFISAHDYDWAVNCAAVSPDGRLRVVVGDDVDVHVADAASGKTLTTLQGHEDFGFACTWADDGIHVATGNQDKQVRIYDARRWTEPLVVLHTEVAGARSLRFSPVGGGRPVLLMAEPADYMHLVEATLYEDRQRLDLFGEIAGVAFAPDGHEYFAAISDPKFGGIMQYERTGYGEEFGECYDDDEDDDGESDEPEEDWLTEEQMYEDARVPRTHSWRKERKGMDLSQLFI